jgi:hypothetical protein
MINETSRPRKTRVVQSTRSGLDNLALADRKILAILNHATALPHSVNALTLGSGECQASTLDKTDNKLAEYDSYW